MDFGNYLFSFTGRINRAKIWLFVLLAIGADIVFGILFTVVFGLSFLSIMGAFTGHPAMLFAGGTMAMLGGVLLCVFYVLLIYCGLAVSAKRLHDRNKSAWWLVVFVVLPFILNIVGFTMSPMDLSSAGLPQSGPGGLILRLVALAIYIWAFVELYCLKGTTGDNPYGPDPLAGKT